MAKYISGSAKKGTTTYYFVKDAVTGITYLTKDLPFGRFQILNFPSSPNTSLISSWQLKRVPIPGA